MPPTHNPLRLEGPILSWMRSPVTSRSNWAKDSSTAAVPELVLKDCVTDTTDTAYSPDLNPIGIARRPRALGRRLPNKSTLLRVPEKGAIVLER
jgi:hypothetical protein